MPLADDPLDEVEHRDHPLRDLTRDEERYVRLMLRMLKSGMYARVEARVNEQGRLVLRGTAHTEYECQ